MDTALRFDGLTKVFGEGESAVTAVRDATLEVTQGELVLIMGPSGSGKTTMLSMCGGLLRPSSGRIWVGDLEITGLTEKELPAVRLRKMGFIFQAFNLLANLTVLENVRVVLDAAALPRAEAVERAGKLLEELRMQHRLGAYPDSLSGGEKQRVAIARALANDPPLLLADEPTGNLDSKNGYQAMHMLELLAKERGKTVLCVTHDNRIEDVADRVLWLEDGVLSERPPEEADLVEDPACGMTINAERAAASRVVEGDVVYFCSEICVDRYNARPAQGD